MKLRVFRYSFIVVFSLLTLLGLFFAIYNIVLAPIRQDDSYLLYLICFLIGLLFSFFETYFIIKSFKEGTLILHDLCMKEKTNHKNKITLIISSVISMIIFAYFIFNLLIYSNKIEINLSLMACEFNIYFCLLALTNSIMIIIYWLFIVLEDFEISR